MCYKKKLEATYTHRGEKKKKKKKKRFLRNVPCEKGKEKEVWQKINPFAFQLLLRYWKGWGVLTLDSE